MSKVSPALDFVIVEGETVLVGRSSQMAVQLNHPTVSRRHAALRRFGPELEIIDLDSSFGTFVNGARIKTVRANVGDLVQFGSVSCRVLADGLSLDERSEGIALFAQGLEIRRNGRVLVSGASLEINPNAFVGILGPSGAGKSTLLKCLSGLFPPDDGQLCFDEDRNVRAERDSFRSLLGFVPQQAILFESLTVYENLRFAARLRLGDEVIYRDINAPVKDALERLGMVEHATKSVMMLSGGQKNRVSVAIELLRRPRLLLLDEPTSGLDPASEANLMEQLRYVARRGTTVICTTHLMENVRLLDQIIVLGVKSGFGQIAFVGHPDELLEHFQCQSYADLYERLQAGQFDPVRATLPLPAGDNDPGELPGAVQGEQSGSTETASGPNMATGNIHAALADMVIPTGDDGNWPQTRLVAQRGLLQLIRDQGQCLTLLAQPVLLGALVCASQYRTGREATILFFSTVLAVWFGLNNSARDSIHERKHYVRDRLAGLRPGAYLSGKVIVYLVIGVVQLIVLLSVMISILRAMSALTEAPSLALWFFVLSLTYIGGLGLGFFASSVVNTEATAVAAIPLLILPQLLLSAVAVGVIDENYIKDRPFRPLALMFESVVIPSGTKHESESVSRYVAMTVEVLSLGCLSRPATLVLDPDVGKAPSNYSDKHIWLVDLMHLIVLTILIWLGTHLTFRLREEYWPRSVGF